jgi:hypothetical protein
VEQLAETHNMSSYNFETRKSLHINLTSETHSSLKICSFKHRLSMQEIFEELAIRLVDGEAYMQDFLKELAEKKKQRAIKKVSQTDAESIFKAIEDEATDM